MTVLVAGAAFVGPFGLVVDVAMAAPRNAPSAPSNLQATVDGPRVSLAWTDTSDAELGFRLIREKLMGTSWQMSAGFTLSANTVSLVDEPGPGNFRYKLRAYNARGNSSYTRPVLVTVSGDSVPQPPLAPANLRVTNNGDGTATAQWEDRSQDEMGFEVERQPASSGIATVGANMALYSEATGAGQFSYRVRAVNSVGPSPFTDFVDVTVTVPDAPGGDPGDSGGTGGDPGGTGGGTGGDSGSFLVIPAGYGFMGPTATPPPIGAPGSPGYDAKAIARWDVVPFQTITGEFNVGVVAFHINGIDRVEFSANGGAWVSVNNMQLNPQTGVWEYTAKLQAASFPDGPVEVRAVVIPRVGEARVLEPLFLSANGLGSLPASTAYVSSVVGSDVTGDGTEARPYKSINLAAKRIETAQGGAADGGVIYLLAGDHFWGEAGRDADSRWIGYPLTNSRMLTIEAAPGTALGSVRITSDRGGGLRTKLVCVRGVTVVRTSLDNGVPPTGGSPMIWVDRCDFTSNDPSHLVNWASDAVWPGGVYATNVTVTASANGWQNTTLLRNAVIDGIGNDALINCKMVINAKVTNIVNPPESGFHSDVLQYFAVAEAFDNIIVYNLRAYNNNAQGFHIGYTGHIKGPEWSNFAFVNMLNDFSSPTAQWIPDANHVLWWNLTFPSMVVFIRDNPLGEPTTIRNLSICNSVFNRFGMDATGGPSRSDLSWASNNHFIDTTTYGAMTVGSLYTTGGTLTSLFNNPSLKDYRPASASALQGRVATPKIPCDARNASQVVPASSGAEQP